MVGSYKNGERRFEIRHLNDVKIAHPDSLAAPVERPKLGRPAKPTSPMDVQSPTDGPLQATPSNEFDNFPSKAAGSESDSQSKQAAGRVGTRDIGNHETSTPWERGPALTANEEFTGSVTGPPPQPAFSRPIRSTRNPAPYYVDGFGLHG